MVVASPVWAAPDCPNCQRQNNCSGPCATCAFCHQRGGDITIIPSSDGQPLGQFQGLGPLGDTLTWLTQTPTGPLGLLNKILSLFIGVITAIGFIYFIILFFTAALSWISAGGDQKKVESAGKQITNAIIGLVILVAAIFIAQLLGTILGIDILNPFGFILKIWS